MTTDIAHLETNALATLDSAGDALERLGRWVDAARHAHQLVAPLVGTAFVPDAYKPKVDPRATAEQKAEARQTAIANATAAVLQGITLGLDPLTSLQQIYIVNGRPGMYTRIMVALVQSRGHEVWVEDLTDTRAVVRGRRKGTEDIVTVTITMDQARKAGWTRNQQYGSNPQDMLYARAAGRVCQRIAADALMGIASVEEIQDAVAEPSNGMRTVKARRQEAIAAMPKPDWSQLREPSTTEPHTDPPFEPTLEPDPEPVVVPEASTGRGRRKKVEDAPPLDDDWPSTAQPPLDAEAGE